MDTTACLPCGCPRAHFSRRSAGGFGLRYALNLPGCAQGPHRHPEARIVFSMRSGFDSRYGDRTVGVGDSAALFRPAGEEHETYESYETQNRALTRARSPNQSISKRWAASGQRAV